MYQISSFTNDKQVVPLTIPSYTDYNENIYTVIVGKNGVGKSRLLANILSKYVVEERSHKTRSELKGHISSAFEQPRVIAISTSPFDKFRLPSKIKKYNLNSNYRYIGMRGGASAAVSSVSLIASATMAILEKFQKNYDFDKLSYVFETLGISPEIKLLFKPRFSKAKSGKPQNWIWGDNEIIDLDWLREIQVQLDEKLLSLETSAINNEDKKRIKNALSKLLTVVSSERILSVNLSFKNKNLFSLNNRLVYDESILSALLVLFNFGFIRLMDMKLNKKEYGSMSLRRASSGEQCMLVIMLGIAGNIVDNSLIFIDEPEISLHPTWQEDFMPVLIKTFSKYKSCQFFIATHSPQIVSKLAEANCFITSLTKNEIYPSAQFYERSSDYQLAELFGAPGFRNEYIVRRAFSLLSKVKKQKHTFEKDLLELDKLLSLSKQLDSGDPTLELINSIKEIANHYASNK